MFRTWPRRIALTMCVVLGLFWIINPTSQAADAQVRLNQLSGMTDAETDAFLKAHPDLAMQLTNSAPADMAKYWKSQSASDRKSLVETVPELVGNLDGIDYATRDEANRAHLVAAMADAQKAAARRSADLKTASQLAALKAIDGALRAGGLPLRYLVSFTDDQPPLAAISLGNLDTARIVTWNVPGMGTFTNDMQLWTQSSQNVWDTQGEVGANQRRAVVSWIGYKTPPPGIDATLGGYAARGAPLLADDIEGLIAARASAKTIAPIVNVVAHSYGTTTAANALHDNDLGIYSFVMVGSAGIENDIPHASDLHAAHVYAGEAAQDPEAVWGRLSRHDPRAPGFGATVIEVDGDARLNLLPVTGHDPILHSEWNDDPLSSAWSKIKDEKVFEQKYSEHESTFGYLDYGTESLLNIAIATTPTPNQPLVSSRQRS